MFELQAGTAQCPFCNVSISPDLDSEPSDASVGGAIDPLRSPVPQPGGLATPDMTPIQGTMDPSAPVMHEDTPAPVEPALPGAAAARANALKAAAIAGGAILVFKLGMLDNLLALVGISSPPPPAMVAPAEPVPVPMPEPTPAAAPEAPFNPNPPSQGGPVGAAPEAPAAPAAPVAVEWHFEGKLSDILSMKPVKGAVLLFMTQAEDETFEARSDAKGRFEVKLAARRDGYKLVIDHAEYIADYFDETEPPYRSWTQARRRQLRAAKPSHKAWFAPSADTVRRDVLLFPEFTDR